MNRGLKIGAGQRSRSMALAKWIAASGDENAAAQERLDMRSGYHAAKILPVGVRGTK